MHSSISRIFFAVLVVALLVAHVNCAKARTVKSCREQWMDNDSKVLHTTPCKTRIKDERGRFFAVINGKPYFHVTVREFSVSSTFGRFDTQNIAESRNFWPLEGIVQLENLRTWSRAGSTAPRYATDGHHVFNQWKLIDGADPASFEVLNAQLTAPVNDDEPDSEETEWSRDKRNLYYRAQAVPHANPANVRRISDKLIVSNGRVFEINFDEVKERNDLVLPSTP